MKLFHRKAASLGFWVMALLAVATFCAKQEDPAFVEAEMAWRQERDQSMREETSWLTIAGLFWLDEGENPFGTDSENRIQLPSGSAPESAGTFISLAV